MSAAGLFGGIILGVGDDLLVDRRIHRRYGLQRTGSRAWSRKVPGEEIALVNVSYGGLCLEPTRPYRVGAVHELQLDLRGPLDEWVLVTVAVRWTERVGERWRCGAEVLESTKGLSQNN